MNTENQTQTLLRFILLVPVITLGILSIIGSGGGGGGGDDGGGGERNPSVAAKTSAIAPGDIDCPHGGVLVETGIDENANGVLDANEVDEDEKVCNGAPGANGANGTSGLTALVETSTELAGANCADGGIRMDAGLDVNSNGSLDNGEFSTVYVCNGVDGVIGPQGPAGADGANWWDDLGTTGALEGYVYKEEGTPAEGAIVTISGTHHYAFADGFGYYRFDYIAVGKQNINIYLDGYYTKHLEDQSVTAGNTTGVRNARLNKKRLPLPAMLSLQGAKAFTGQAAGDLSGISVAIAGDVNGDGYDDLLIGAYGANSDAGESYLIYGRPGLDLSQVLDKGLGMAADVTFMGVAVGDQSGNSVAGAGDVNGDGYDDILIAAPGASSFAGESYLIYGGLGLPASLALSNAHVTLSGLAPAGETSTSVAGAGDVNGDGYDDILIGVSGVGIAGESYLVYGGPGLSASLTLSSADVTLSGAAAGDQSGYSVAGAGDVNGDGFDDVLIGANVAAPGGNNQAGESYLVYGGPGLPPSLALSSANVILSGVAASDESGYSVAGAGDVNGDGYDDILIGAPGADPGGNAWAGESYLVYGGPALAASLSLASADVIFSGVAAGDNSGGSVAGAGDVNDDGYDDILIGAGEANSVAGESYLVYGGPSLPASLALSNAHVTLSGVPEDNSGWSVAGAGDVNGDGYDDMLIGAYQAWPDGIFEAGQSYLVMGRPRGVDTPSNQLSGNYSLAMADARFMGAAAGDRSGVSVASAGDVNGDGYTDILIGAYMADPGGSTDAGESYLVYGRSGMDINQALGMEANVTFIGVAAGDQSGLSVAGAGDVNGDGYDDLLIGANKADPLGGNINAGESYLVYGGPGLPTSLALSSADVILSGVGNSDQSGTSVAGVGDVNGDGYDDILIGAYTADPGGINSNTGESYLVYGGPSLAASISLGSADVILSGVAANDQSGFSVAGAGDVNGDEFDDILIGAIGANSFAGESYLVYGGSGLPVSMNLGNADVTLSGVAANDYSGYSVAGAGDVNGDGYDDLLIGARAASPGGNSNAGESYLVYGGPSLAGTMSLGSADTILSGIAVGDSSGISVSGAGDVNGDGFDDILIGANGADPAANSNAGESYLFYGGLSLPASTTLNGADVVLSGTAVGGSSGFSVSGAGDVNGDGFDDLLIGAWLSDLNGNNDAGESYLFLGQGSRPVE